MVFCPPSRSPTSRNAEIHVSPTNNNSVVTTMMCPAAPSCRASTTTIPAHGTPISILDFASMTDDQQKIWLTESGARYTKQTSSLRRDGGRKSSESAMYDTSKAATNLSLLLDDSSISSSSYTSDCEEDRVVPTSTKRFIFLPYWDLSGQSQAEEGCSPASTPRKQMGTVGRPRNEPEQALQHVFDAALDACRVSASEHRPRWHGLTMESATILPNLLRDLSFAEALLLADEAPDTQNNPHALTHSRSIDSLKSMSSILKNGSLCSSEQASTKTSTKRKQPVTFDPRVQVIVFQEDRTVPGSLKLPLWLSRSLNFCPDAQSCFSYHYY